MITPAKVKQLGYLTIGVADLDEGIEFYSRIARLALIERRGRTAFMSGGLDHHWLRLEEGSPGAQRVAFEAVDEAALDAVRADLVSQGIAVAEGGDMNEDRVRRWLRFVDPAGVEMELFVDMQQCPVAPPSPGVTIEKFLHAGFEVPNYDAAYTFYTQTLGFKASDFIGSAVSFLRCGDRFHHSLVMIRSAQPKPTLNHFCMQVAGLDDVMRFRHNAVRHGVALRDDLLRHAPSGSVGVYVKDEARGFAVEYCYGHPQVDDGHRPRILPMAVETVDVWRAPLPDLVPASSAPAAPAGPATAADAEAGGRSPAFELLSQGR